MEHNEVNLLDLPNMILVQILQNLSTAAILNVRQTCSKLYQVSYDEKILEKQQFVYNQLYGSSPEQLFNLLDRSTGSHFNLQFYNTIPPSNIFFLFLYQHGSRIRSLTFNHISLLHFDTLVYVIFYCYKLKELSLSRCCVYKSISKFQPNVLVAKKNLETLKLQKCAFESLAAHIECIDFLLGSYPNIKKFVYNVTKEFPEIFPIHEFQCVEDYMLKKIYHFNKLIQCLVIKTPINKNLYRLVVESRNFKDNQIKSLASSPLILQSLSIYLDYRDSVSVSNFENLFLHQINLKELDVRYHSKFNRKFLGYLLTRCPKLEKLCISGSADLCFEDIMEMVHQHGRNIKTLIHPMTTFSMNKILKLSDPKFPNLHHVELQIMPIKLSQIQNLAVLQSCNLTHLCITYRSVSSPALLKTFFEFISAFQSTLVYFVLKLTYNGTITKMDDLLIIPLRFPKLEQFFLYLTVLTDNFILNNHICQNCSTNIIVNQILGDFNFPCLRRFEIETPYEIENKHEMLIRGCPVLEELLFATFHLLHDDTLRRILRRFCPLRSCTITTNEADKIAPFICYETNFKLVMKKWSEFLQDLREAFYNSEENWFIYRIKSTI